MIITAGIVITCLSLYLLYDMFFTGSRWVYIVIHHTASKKGNLTYFRQIHMTQKGWPDIAYHFVIDNGTMNTQMGAVEISNLWRRNHRNFGTNDSKHNAQSIAIALIGNFEKTQVPHEQWHSLVGLTLKLAYEHKIPIENIIGHREVSNSVCPGKYLSIKMLQQDVRARLKQILKK